MNSYHSANYKRYTLFTILLTLFLSACSKEETKVQTTTGIFTDSFVSSLNYKCSSDDKESSLLTNELGEFTCKSDENISFSIGEHFYLGQTAVKKLITPLSLYPNDAPKVLNLIQLLQTLDEDNNPENGIQLSNSLIAKLQSNTIALDDAEFDTKIETLLSKTVVTPEIAFTHFSKTVNSLGLENFSVDYTTPLFTSKDTFEVYENTKEIATITATDNASLSYSINSSKTTQASDFSIDAKSGALSFTFTPNYELQKNYKVTINITDGINRASKEFRIKILDSDENPPLISTPSEITVEENQLEVITIDAEDENTLHYSLSGEDSDFFKLDAQTGELTFKEMADYEKQKSYKITLSVSDGINITNKDITVFLLDEKERDIPLLAIIMNWSDYSETSALLWHNKLFSQESNSVASWYRKNTQEEINLLPATESSGTVNDGIIMLDMKRAHPGSINSTLFRDSYIKSAITSSEVVDSIDFSKYDTNGDKMIDREELQILFIVAGGEESYGDNPSHSVWALAWSFENYTAPKIDGVEVMKYTGDAKTSGSFLLFGANHGDHKATIGIIAHEMGHSLLDLFDYYDDGGGSGLGVYDIMSGGSWAYTSSDYYSGETPTQFSLFNKMEADFTNKLTTLDASQTLTIQCSSNEGIKLKTKSSYEYFLIECRDTNKQSSDLSFASFDYRFSDKLFTAIYHVDDRKDSEGYFIHANTEDGLQTSSHHYNLSLLEKERSFLMTSSENIEADYADVYREGDFISNDRFELYDGTLTGFSVEILEEDYSKRSVTIKVMKEE